MTKTIKTKAMTASEILVPLNRLKASPKNVRKVPHADADITALAASIEANGLLQNLVVGAERKEDKLTGHYLVTVGEGRRLAMLRLAKQKKLAKDHAVRCLIGITDKAEEASLAENVIRSRMHPADEYEAFAVLHHEKGMPVEDVAARFGVTAAVVRQRLKLGAVSPTLMAHYRAGELNLEQMMAFTLTDDHDRQVAVYEALGWDKSPYAIRQALTEGQVPMTDRRVAFIGADAYTAAGGAIVRDLFDDDNAGYLTDAAFLDRLVAAKLEADAEAVRAEGWAWVKVVPSFDHAPAAGLRRIYPKDVPLSEADGQAINALEAEQEELSLLVENDQGTEATGERLADIERALAALQSEQVFDADDMARAGAFVMVGYDGATRVERGFIRKEDEQPGRGADTGDSQADEKPRGLPESLVAELTARRTLALREAMASNTNAALMAVVQALALNTFYRGNRTPHLGLTVRSDELACFLPDIGENPLGQKLEQRHAHWMTILPPNPDDLWDVLVSLTWPQLLDLLAYCAALTVNCVVQTRHDSSVPVKHAQKLAQALSVDMAEHWQPSTGNYLGRVNKPLILEAVREAVSPQAADNIAKLKKGEMAKAAEQLLADKRWLPPVLRAEAA